MYNGVIFNSILTKMGNIQFTLDTNTYFHIYIKYILNIRYTTCLVNYPVVLMVHEEIK